MPSLYVACVYGVLHTLPGQKFRDKVKYTLPISAIYGLNI